VPVPIHAKQFGQVKVAMRCSFRLPSEGQTGILDGEIARFIDNQIYLHGGMKHEPRRDEDCDRQ
jgi:hypothetical protein